MKKIVIILLCIFSNISYGIQFPFLSMLLTKSSLKIKQIGSYKAYANGSFAKSCNEYKNLPQAGYSYQGDIGDGIYRIKPDSGTEFDVFCDMTTQGGGWTQVMNLEALDDTYGWSNAFWTNSSTLNTTVFNTPNTQTKYQSFNNVAGTNILFRSYQGGVDYVVNSGTLGSSKTMYQVMQSPVNTVFGSVGINMQVNSTYYPTYGVNYYRIGPATGNVYYSNIGWGTAQVSVQNPPAGCGQHSGGNWGINSYNCQSCSINNGWGYCWGTQNLWNAQVFIK